ncbi:LacI family DNA-binding transcriptional regulator [Bifidobacterium callimiconis]|uniref:LacI family transcriptional regulator n=1 Tax=Bifidobacterium callimiconis TaxID=2306973 RepID=A0A430FB52_9BIFI|nr:LacI family DNA-binding transcriptional regulator [Bifidobacterium callimiconis]MBT1177752.1 LacI family DNA-binding transcriptional regulator [Bifidobacterium callimiconis]RSX50074.1 LacI family transcriptional regulator [Bifidobacterium callimiconis]
MQATIQDVAAKAGVSISTVSRAFTRPDMVSERTRAKVMRVADELDFNISRSAATLKSGRTNRVALLMNDSITSWFNAAALAGLESVLHPAGYDIALFPNIDTARIRQRFFETLPIRRNVDAVFVASFAIDPHEVEQLKRAQVPIIGINTPDIDGFDASVSIDDEQGMLMAAQHLIKLGHRHLAYVCAEAVPTLSSSIDKREQGFRRACETAQANGIDLDWHVIAVPRDQSALAAISSPQALSTILSRLLALDTFPDAICCQADVIAIPLMLRLERYGKRTPRDYSIIGFDDSTYADVLGLTTIRQDPQTMGADAARKALRLIAGKPLGDGAHETAPVSLMPRNTDDVVG